MPPTKDQNRREPTPDQASKRPATDSPAAGDNRRADDPDGNKTAGDGKAPGVNDPEGAE